MDWFASRGIPRKDECLMLLDLPDIRQAEDYDCGAAALDCVARFYGLRERGPSKLANAVQGMAPDTVEAWLRAVGLKVLSGTMTVADLKHLTASGRPVLCCVALAGGHWVAVRGVSRGRVYFQCPTNGPLSLSVAAWEYNWADESLKGKPFVRWGICPSR